MPNFDKKGPAGEGPMTGRGKGKCLETQPLNIGGKGMRRGRGFCGNVSLSLEDQEKFLENRLEAVRKLKKNNSQK